MPSSQYILIIFYAWVLLKVLLTSLGTLQSQCPARTDAIVWGEIDLISESLELLLSWEDCNIVRQRSLQDS